MNKKFIRNEMLTALNKLTKTAYRQSSFAIKDQFIASDEFKKAETIGITLSRFPEVNTRPIIEAAWAAGKRVAVPKCIRATSEMDFRLITSYEHLETVYIDLIEPIVSETEAVSKAEIDLQIVPGLVYSDEGFRIGFGGGYYDRYMVEFNGRALSLAFVCQTGKLVPVESHDIPVEKIFTEQDVIICRKKERDR